jgi:HSP20 family molecular chaperone IbpA
MSHVAIDKIHADGSQSASLMDGMKSLTERIRQRAYEMFQRRGGQDGTDLDDWFAAERDVLGGSPSELVEKDGQFEVQIALPGFDADEVHVTALPEAIIVHGESSRQRDRSSGEISMSEYNERSLYRKVDLPAPINVDKVTANLDKGVLKLAASKAA